MTIPGFTAESSLTKANKSYALTLNRAPDAAMIVPQWCCDLLRCIQGHCIYHCYPGLCH